MNSVNSFQDFDYTAIKEFARKKVTYCGRILDKHTDIISSCGILAITTSLLISQIFQKIPRILPRVAKVVYDFGGIIWLNVQVRDFLKSGRDLYRAGKAKDSSGTLQIAAKVFVKGVNIILTCAIFTGSMVAACGFPQFSLSFGLAIRPLGLACLALNILSDISDYSINEKVLLRFTKYEKANNQEKIRQVIADFTEIINREKSVSNSIETIRFADLIVRQLDTQTVETFHEVLSKKISSQDDALKIFHSIKEGMNIRQSGTKANLSLIGLGYISMGICRAFPNTLSEMFTRWSMSVLYTDELIRQKLFQRDLQTVNII